MPISSRRGIAPSAEFVCSVELLFEGHPDRDIPGQVVVLPPPVVQVAAQDLHLLHEGQVLDEGLRGEGEPLRELGDKAGLLLQEADDAPPVPVPQDIQDPGVLVTLEHPN